MWQGKNRKKGYLRGKNCQGDLQQENYLDGQIKGTTKNIRADQREIGDDGKGKNLKEEEQ